jgi:hypothetical protein
MTLEDWYERLRTKNRKAEAYADACEDAAEREMAEGNPRNAQVNATLAVSARLEALSCAIGWLADD